MSRHQTKDTAKAARCGASQRPSERGYTLLALIVGMTISLIFMAAAMPSIKHQAQREREEEMFWRGQQVAIAIQRYHQMLGNNTQWPTELDKLADNFVINGKKVRFLRTSALRDPMTAKGDWQPIRMGDPLVGEFALAYMTYTKAQLPPGSILAEAFARSASMLKLSQDNQGNASSSPGSSGSSDSSSSFKINSEFGPIVGVVSKSKEHLIRTYYDVATYDQALFIQGVRLPGQYMPFGGGAIIPRGLATPNPSTGICPAGQVCPGACSPPKRWINGVCQDPPPATGSGS